MSGRPVATSCGRRGAADLRPSHHPPHTRHVLHPGRHTRCRRHAQRRLQVVADQGVLERGSGVADRDRDQRPHRPWLPAPVAQPARTASPRPRRQHPPADAATCRPSCAISTALFERIALPSVEEGQRTGALRFGDPRVMALAGALCAAVHTIAGFTNRSLRARVAGLLGEDYSASQMSYDLRRLRRKHSSPVSPAPTPGHSHPTGHASPSSTARSTTASLTPLCAADHPPAPIELRRALQTVDHHIDTYITNACIREAA